MNSTLKNKSYSTKGMRYPSSNHWHTTHQETVLCHSRKKKTVDICKRPKPEESKYSYQDPVVQNMKNTKDKQSVIIFDWDDTLLCSSYISRNSIETVTEADAKHFKTLEIRVITILKTALAHCKNVFIITNAEVGWVELSAKTYIPGVIKWLKKLDGIISARSTYEQIFPLEPVKWKKFAFKRILSDVLNAKTTNNTSEVKDLNLLSFGDSQIERFVSLSYKNCNNTVVKSVKFLEQTDIAQLSQQLDLINRVFKDLLTSKGHLDLTINV